MEYSFGGDVVDGRPSDDADEEDDDDDNILDFGIVVVERNLFFVTQSKISFEYVFLIPPTSAHVLEEDMYELVTVVRSSAWCFGTTTPTQLAWETRRNGSTIPQQLVLTKSTARINDRRW